MTDLSSLTKQLERRTVWLRDWLAEPPTRNEFAAIVAGAIFALLVIITALGQFGVIGHP